LAESLSAPAEDLWLPLTDRATARQKFQRAFAAEFLAPIDEVSDRLGSSRTSESVEDVADEYCVSPLAIRSHLANHGLLAPDEVAV
jgi:Zn-dependent peptidase ImmA (M78 family)